MSGTNGGMPGSGLQNMGLQNMGMQQRMGNMPMMQQQGMAPQMMPGATQQQMPQAIPPAYGGGQQTVQMGQNPYQIGMQQRFNRQY